MRPDLLPKLDCPCCRAGEGLLAAVLGREEGGRISRAVLRCPKCRDWFPVMDRVADLVALGLREPGRDAVFVAGVTDSDRGLMEAAGVGLDLSLHVGGRGEEEQRILDDANYWGAFMQRHWDVGDRTIFDLRRCNTHPTLFPAGILEPDGRDLTRRFGLLPDRIGKVLYPWLGTDFGGRWAIDIGCGGGQQGLEAARRGVKVVGIDPGWNNLRLAADYAREQGVEVDHVRCDPSRPPFKEGAFSLLVAKDALHHIPRLEETLPRLLALLEPGGELAVFEHVGKSPLKRAVLGVLSPRLVAKALRRWPRVEPPPELHMESANEDVSMSVVVPLLRSSLERIAERRALLLDVDVEALVHYAFGKRRWLDGLARRGALLLEMAVLPFQPTEHWFFRGRVARGAPVGKPR